MAVGRGHLLPRGAASIARAAVTGGRTNRHANEINPSFRMQTGLVGCGRWVAIGARCELSR